MHAAAPAPAAPPSELLQKKFHDSANSQPQKHVLPIRNVQQQSYAGTF
jgi:hypothetical protein